MTIISFSVFLFTADISLFAQEPHHAGSGNMPHLTRRALAIDIDARILNETQQVIWSEPHRKLATPGSPVGIQLVGSNIVVAVQFTPFIRRSGNVLVAQSQIWIGDADRGISYYTSIQTIPMEFGEPLYFFPLGQSQQVGGSSIEIILTVNPYSETGTENAAAGTNNDR
jgi:hypothetical protein